MTRGLDVDFAGSISGVEPLLPGGELVVCSFAWAEHITSHRRRSSESRFGS